MPLSKIVGLMTATLVFAVAASVQGAGGRPPDPSRLPGGQVGGGWGQPAAAGRGMVATAESLTASVRVNSVITGGQHLPTITVGPGGQVYVAWVDCLTDQDCSTANPDIYFAKSTDGGQHFSARVLVSDDGPTAFANAPKIATDQNGTIYIVWHDNRAATLGDDSWDVYLSKSTDGGVSFSDSVLVDQHIANDYQYEPDLAVTPSGTVYVSWHRYYFDSQLQQWDYDVYVAKSVDGGSSFGTNVKVNGGTSYQYKSAIGVGPSGNVYVAWTDWRDDGIGDIYFARSTNGGTTFPTNIRVNTYTAGTQAYPELAIDGDETIYVVWLDGRRQVDASNDVYMARSTSLGLNFGNEIRMSDQDISTEASDLYPVVSATGHGFVAVAWYDQRTGDWDTYMTRSNDAGLTHLPSWRVNDLTPNSQSVPDIFMTSNRYVYCAYRDRSSGDFDIYFVLDTTTEATDTLTVTKSGTGFGTVTSNPSGVNCRTTCSAQFPTGTSVTLTASADVGSVFAGWSGEGCTGTDTCQVAMTQARSVVAAFSEVGPAIILSRSALYFGGTSGGVIKTSGQQVVVSVQGSGSVTWTVAASSFIQVSPTSGTGAGAFTVSIKSGTSTSRAGTVTVTAPAAVNSPQSVGVTYTVYSGATVGSFGYIDSPVDGVTGVVGAVPFTGWALDDIEVQRVEVWRDPFGAEPPTNPNGFVYVGVATLVSGQRPDVEAAYPTYPYAYRAAWGYSLLSNLLPSGGNGVYRLRAYAYDVEGHQTNLGSRSFTAANATATKPFGTIDTPGQGATISGAGYVSWGWALTPQAGMIPLDGSTITVYIDGQPVGQASYGYARSDIDTLFPGLQNTGQGVGYYVIDTTALANGIHTIVWGVSDNLGRAEGLGSRYFWVLN